MLQEIKKSFHCAIGFLSKNAIALWYRWFDVSVVQQNGFTPCLAGIDEQLPMSRIMFAPQLVYQPINIFAVAHILCSTCIMLSKDLNAAAKGQKLFLVLKNSIAEVWTPKFQLLLCINIDELH